ncbi:MAG: putative peptidase, partial [Pedosphaera sp.]|nr:putative peptidase [Pedosphaera sp.]
SSDLSSSRQAALYINIGSGSYSNSLLVLPPVSEGAVAWADFDGDGDQDFVLTGSTNGTASGAVSLLYRNQGSAGFVQVPTSLPGVYRSSVAWADFDCDGDPDLLIAGVSATGPVTVLFRNDNGTLTPGPVFPGLADGALAWGDADQDGYPDLALSGRLATGSGSLFAGFYWNRAGVFTNSQVDLPAMHFSAMAWGDLDYDGQLDLAMSGATNGSLSWGGSAFSAVYRNTVVAVGSTPPVPVSLTANVQGSDVLLSWAPPGGAPGGLSYDVRVGTSPGGTQIVSPAANTANGIRRLAQPGQAGWSKELRLRNLSAGTYYWSAQSVNPAYKGSAFAVEGQFTIVNTQPTITTIAAQTMAMNGTLGPLSFTIGDAETDPASLTVAAVSSNTNLFPVGSVVLSGSGANRAATFTPAVNQGGSATIIFTVSDPDGGSRIASTRITVSTLVDAAAPFPIGRFSILEPGDVDGDGDLDFLIAGTEFTSPGSGHTYVRLFLNAGNATFTSTTPNLPAVFDGSFAAWGDYDNDGDLDLFYDGSIYRQDSGSFTLVSSPVPGSQEGQAAWGDYDGDGDLDLAVTGEFGFNVFVSRIYRNDGNSIFTLINAPLQGLWFSAAAWADVDGDGDLDLAIAGAAAQNTTASANARLYRNDGGDQFVEALSIFGAAGAKLTWGDVNGDGLPDLAVTGYHGSGTGSEVNDLQLNLGQWQFKRFALHPGGSAYADTKLLDWDRDGDLDLLGGVNSIVAVFANPGTGEFASSSMATASLRCSALRWGDFDNDSDFDVFVHNIGTVSLSGTNKLYLNPIVNTQPAPPGAMTHVVNGNSVALSWPALAPINGAPATYNLRVGTAPGLGNVLVPHSRSDGRRLVPATGNAGYANARTLRQLPPGTYWWTVQAVDNRWHGQPWLAEQSFTITSSSVFHINSIEQLSALQTRLKFDAPAGRTVSVQASTNLVNWAERTSVPVGLSGTAGTTVSVTGDKTFFRLAYPN